MSYTALAYLRRQYLCVLRRNAFLNAFASWMVFAAPAALAGPADIVTDGRTATTLSSSGNVTDVSTATVKGQNAFNSFNRFNIGAGQTVNLHVPDQATNLLNLVRKERSVINGVMNAYKDGRIGGNVFFFNPHGVVIGQQGQVNVGTLTVATPTPEYMERLVGPGGAIDDAAVQQALSGEIPLSPSGLITVKGKINAVRAAQLAAAQVSVDAGARIGAGPAARDGFGALVNIDGLEEGAQMLQDGDAIRIVASDSVNIAGEISADGATGEAAGRIDIAAGGNITVEDGGRVSADGRGAASDGGQIRIYADDTATLRKGSELSARGGEVSGDGGHIEFSATETVRLEGGALKANATDGARGSVLIDPNDIEVVDTDQHTDGADFTLIANNSLTVGENITISTRDLADVNNDDHDTAASQGDSGNLTLRAKHVELKAGSRLLAHADNGHTGGDVTIVGYELDVIGAVRSAEASVTLTDATVKGKDILIRARAETSGLTELLENTPTLSLDQAQAYLNNELDDLSDGPGGEFLALTTEATAITTIAGSRIEGSGQVTIASEAGARAGFRKTATATTTITDSATRASVIRGAQIDVHATADTSLTYAILGTATGLLDQSWLPDPDGALIQTLDDTFFDFSSVPLVALSTAIANTLIDGASDLRATDTIDVNATARSTAQPTFASPFLFSAAWGESTAEARTRVTGTSTLIATNALRITADTETEVSVTASVNSINKPIDAVFVRANTKVVTEATVGDDTTTEGSSIEVKANTEAEIEVTADAKNTGGSGVGMAVAVTDTRTETIATLGGHATATGGNVIVSADADIEENTSANAATLGNPSSISARITNFQAGIQRNVYGSLLSATGLMKPETANSLTSFLFPGIKEGKFNAAGAVGWTDSQNLATASIAPLADVTSAGDVSVTATVTDNPSSSAGSKTSSTGTALGGAVSNGMFANRSHAFIGKGAQVDAHSALIVDAKTLVPYPWQIDWEDPEEILGFLQGGVLDMFLSTYSINSAKGKSGIGLAVGVNLYSLDNDAEAFIDDGALINQRLGPVPALPLQSVKVSASNEVNLTGAVGILSKKFLGTSGGKGAVGGSAGFFSVDTHASATIRDGAKVKSQTTVDVDAKNTQRLVAVAEAGGSSDSIGIEGAVTVNTMDSTAIAGIDDDAEVTAEGNVSVKADADLENISVAGGVVATKGPVGIGFAVSVNTVRSDVDAFIGNFDPLGADADTLGSGSISSGGNVNLHALNDVSQGAYSVVGAIATDSKAQSPTEVPAGAGETQDGGSTAGSTKANKGKFGIAVSGDVSINDITAHTDARITDGARLTRATNTDLDATTDLSLSSLSGAVTLSLQQDGNGLAGSYAQNSLTGATRAFVDDASLTLTGALTADADTTGFIESLTASISATKGKVGVAGSVSINEIDNATQAWLADALVSGATGVALDALDDSSIRSIAGAIAFGGKAGIGLSFAWNHLANDTWSWIDTSDVDSTGLVSVDATTDNSIDTISAAIGASKGQMAGAAAVTVNTIDNSTRSSIGGQRGGDGVDGATGVRVSAADSSSIFGLAGAAGAAKGTGVGLSFAWNDVDNTVDAGLINATDVASTAGDIDVTADSTTRIESIAVGGGAASKLGLSGSGAVTQAGNTVKAHIDAGSTATADGNIRVAAADDVDLFSLAGNVAGAGTGAIALSSATLITENTVEARLDGTATGRGKRSAMDVATGTKDSTGALETESRTGVAVTATSHEDIESIAAGGAGAGKVGAAGSATVTVMNETTTAAIGASAQVNAADDGSTSQDVVVRASDETTLLGVAGAVGFGGSGGVGAGADVGVITKTTTAQLDAGAQVTTNDTAAIEARSREDITSVAASLAGGGSAGIAGSASVYTVDVITGAHVGDNATLHSDGNVIVSADDRNEMDMIAGNGAFGGTAGVGASAAVAIVTKTTTADIGENATVTALGRAGGVTVADGSFDTTYTANGSAEGEISAPAASNPDGSDSQALSGQRTGTRGTQSGFKGLAVTATNQDDIETISATGSAAGTAAITLAGDVNVITTTTTAEIARDAQINQSNAGASTEQSVLVAAGNDHYQMGIAGSASGAGTVGIGAGADVLVASHTTRALIGEGADLRTLKDVSVIASGQEEILSIAAGLGVGGTVGVAGSTSVISLDTTTEALTGTGSAIDADGNVIILAHDDTETDVIDGTLAVGLGAAGVGGAVGVMDIEKDTTAGVGVGATVKARGLRGTTQAYSGETFDTRTAVSGLVIEATSSEDLFSVTAAGAGGFYAGVSGAVMVTSLDSDTTAVIGNGAQINQGVTGSATQDVNVTARNEATLEACTGSLGAGAVGAAGAVDVGTIRNDTTAMIDDNAKVDAERDVDVNALSSVLAQSTVVSAAGGLGGIAGAIAVYSIGSGLDSAQREKLDSDGGSFADANSYADDQAGNDSINQLLSASDDSRIRDAGARSQTARAGVSISSDLGSLSTAGTTAAIGDADVDAGEDIDIDARQYVTADLTAGAAAAGGLGLGAGVAVLGIHAGTAADVAAGALLGSDGALSLDAVAWTTGLTTGFAGALGGVVAVDAAVAVVNDNSVTTANLGDGVEVVRASEITVNAKDDRLADSDATGASASGGIAAGASVATADIGGSVSASVGDNARIGQSGGVVGRLEVSADSTARAYADTLAGKAGLGLAASGSVATARTDPQVSATLGTGGQITVSDDIDVSAEGNTRTAADAIGVNVSAGVGIGASIAKATTAADVTSLIGAGSQLTAKSLNQSASLDKLGNGTTAHATGAAGGVLLGAAATDADARSLGTATAQVGDGSQLDIETTAKVSATQTTSQSAETTGITGGLLAAGSTKSTARADSTTRAIVGDQVSLGHGGGASTSLSVEATGNDTNRADTIAGSGGLGSLVAASAVTDSDSTTAAALGTAAGGSGVIRAGEVTVAATQTTNVNATANSTNASVVGYSGARATNTVDTETTATLGRGITIETAKLAATATNQINKAAVSGFHVDAGAGGLLNGSAAASTSTLRNQADVRVGEGALITVDNGTDAGGTLTLAALNAVDAHDTVRLDSGGAIAVARSESTINSDKNAGTVTIGGNATLKSDGEINVSARTDADVEAAARSKTYGAAGAAEGKSRAYIKADNTISVAAGAALQSEHDIHLMAGADRSAGNDLNADADTRLWNRTAFPIETDPQAHGEINQHNTVDIASGASVRSVRSVYLTASEGSHSTRGFGEGTDSYREILSAIGEFFGADTSALKIRAGTTADNSNNPFNPGSAVNVGGLVEAGIWHHQYLTYNADGSFDASEQVSFGTRDDVLLRDLLSAEIDALRARAETVRNAADDYQGETSAADYALALDNDADILEAQLAQLGADTRVGFLDVNPILATTGNVDITGDAFTGNGSVTAPGDVRIDVENRSTRFMTTSTLTIPDDDGGKVLFNGRSVSSAGDINARNAFGKSTGVTVTSALNTPKPVIRVENTNDTDVTPTGAAQLWMVGDVSNLRGLAQAKSHGTIRVYGNINAETVDIATDGDFIKTYTPGFTHQGGNPISQLGTLPDTRESAAIGLNGSDSSDSNAGDYATNSVPHLCTGDKCSSTIAGNNVYISGEKLNINGLIQAGLPDRSIVITAALVSAKAGEIAAARAAYALDPANAAQYVDLNAPAPASSDIKVRYDVANERLELANVRMGGGHMELFGNIFSTGNGELKVLDGYGRIQVNNTSGLDLVLNRLDTGPGVEGTIKITDLAKRVIAPGVTNMSGTTNAGTPLVTVISRLGDAVVVTDNRTTDANGDGNYLVSATTGRSGYYDPVANRRFNWINGRKQSWTEERIYTTKIFLGADWLWPDFDDPDKVTAGTPVYTKKLSGDWLSVGGTSTEYTLDYTQNTTSKVRSGNPYEINRVCVGFCDVAIYEEVTIGTKYVWTVYEYFNHSLDASNRINISFTGYDSSLVSVNSTSGQVLLDGLVRSLTGNTTINAGGNIASLSDAGYIVGNNVILNSTGRVGTDTNPVRIDLTDTAQGAAVDGQVWLYGQQGVNVTEIGGDLRVASAASAGTMKLTADRHLTTAAGVTILGNGINLVSESGDIANGTAAIGIDNLGDGVVSALANGDIRLEERSGDLRAGTIESQTGDVAIDVPDGRLLDMDTAERSDDKAKADLLALWDAMRLRGDPARAAADETVANFEARVATDYRDYWNLRNVREDSGNWVADAYDAGYSFKLDTATADALKAANGWGDAEVSAYESERTAFYHSAHTRFGGAAFDPGFSYTASTDESDTLREGAVWNDNQLSTALAAGLFRPVIDTETRIEAANVVGRSVRLNTLGSIGEAAGDIVIARNTDPGTLSDEEKLALLTAEARDVTLTDTHIIISQHEDVDVTATTGLTATAGGAVLIGSEEQIAVQQVRSPGEVRIKSANGIISSAAAGVAAIEGADLVLEGGQGGIGTGLAPMLIDLVDGSVIDARARGDIFISELSGDMNIGSIYSQQTASLVADGAILDAGFDRALDVQGHDVNLVAGTTIGQPGGPEGALEVNVSRDGLLNASAPLGVYLDSVGQTGRIGDIYTAGDFSFFASAGALDVGGTVQARNVTLGADDDVRFTPAGRIDAVETVNIGAGDDGTGSLRNENTTAPVIAAGTSVTLTAPDAIGGPEPLSLLTPQLVMAADTIDVAAASPAGSPLDVTAIGHGGLPASDVRMTLTSDTGVVIDTLYARTSDTTANTPLLAVLNGRLGDYAIFRTPSFDVRIDHHDRRFQPGFDVRGFTLTGNYDLIVDPDTALIGAFVLTQNPRKVVFSNPGGVADLRSRGQLNALYLRQNKDRGAPETQASSTVYASAAGDLVFVDPAVFDCETGGEDNPCADQ